MVKKIMILIAILSVAVFQIDSQESLTILPDGNVGIGTINPSEKLEVTGNIKANGRIFDRTGFVMPVGSIQAYGGTSDPAGWLICDGREVSRQDYADLFAVIGTSFGAGDGSTTFNIPDLRGQFLRGVDSPGTQRGAANVDPDGSIRTVGSSQSDAFQNHVHNMTKLRGLSGTKGNNVYPTVGIGSGWKDATEGLNYWRSPSEWQGNGTPRTASETRPVNICVNFMIKY